MAKSKVKENAKKLLYLHPGYCTSIVKDGIADYTGYKTHWQNFSYNNFYIANKDITEYILDEEVNIVVAEGLGAFCTLFLSNESLPDDHNLVSRLFINPLLKPSADLEELEYSEDVIKTYSTIEINVRTQKYLDIRHSFCIFSKNNKQSIKYAEDFTKKTGIKCLIVDEITKEFVENELKQIVDTLASGREVNIK